MLQLFPFLRRRERIVRMTGPNLPHKHEPHEQRKIDQLLAKLAKMQPTSSKPAVGVRVIKTA